MFVQSQAKIVVEKQGEERDYSIEEFEYLMGISFIPKLDFASVSIYNDIVKKGKKLKSLGKLSREQIWFGSYYKDAIENVEIPNITIRWINDAVGWGVFANRPFKAMDFIGEYCGKLRKRQRCDVKNAYCFEYIIAEEFATCYTIDAREQGSISRFVNHSRQSNIRTALATIDCVSHVILIASSQISKGQQLFYDYGTDYWSRRNDLLNL